MDNYTKPKPRFIKIKDTNKPHHNRETNKSFTTSSKTKYASKFHSDKATHKRKNKTSGYLNTLKSTIKKVKSQIRRKSKSRELNNKSHDAKSRDSTIKRSFKLNTYDSNIDEDSIPIQVKEKKSYVIMKLHNGEKYAILRNKFLMHCNKLSKKLQSSPEDKDIEILLPKWVDTHLFKASNFHEILSLTKKEAHKMFAKIRDIKIIQKLICLAKIFDLDDIGEILVSQAASSVCETSEVETSILSESKINQQTHTLQSVKMFDNKDTKEVINTISEEDDGAGSNFSFDETSFSNKIKVSKNKNSLKVNSYKITPHSKNEESLKNFLRNETSCRVAHKNKTVASKENEPDFYPVKSLFNNGEKKKKKSESASDTNTSTSNFCAKSLKSCPNGFQRGSEFSTRNHSKNTRQKIRNNSLFVKHDAKIRERLFIEKSIDKILSNDINNSTLKLRRNYASSNRSKERKANLQKDIVNMLENSLMLSKSNRSNTRTHEPTFMESIKGSSVAKEDLTFMNKDIQAEKSTSDNKCHKKDTLSKNEFMLLERILEKDDEIKELRKKLDVYQNTNQLNYTQPINFRNPSIMNYPDPELHLPKNDQCPCYHCEFHSRAQSTKNKNLYRKPNPFNATCNPSSCENSCLNIVKKQDFYKANKTKYFKNSQRGVKYQPVPSQTAMSKDKDRYRTLSKTSSLPHESEPHKKNTSRLKKRNNSKDVNKNELDFYGKSCHSHNSRGCLKSGHTSNTQSIADINDIPKEEFGSKVVKFSFKEVDVSHEEIQKATEKELSKLRVSGRKVNNPIGHLKNKSIDKNFLCPNPFNTSNPNIHSKKDSSLPLPSSPSSKPYKSNPPKIKAVINLKSLLHKPTKKTTPRNPPSPKALPPAPSVPAKPPSADPKILKSPNNRESECSEQIFNNEVPKSTHRTTNNYQSHQFSAAPDSCTEQDTLCNYEEKNKEDSSLDESSMKPMSEENTERKELKVFKTRNNNQGQEEKRCG
ncbi:unnamed protein product [Moneuplotes crassus]|uniref:Uncharacterized protein n=1 Tax=Euplotes crassus TaxID=5936 RepID=A0AAD1XM85_EUPCR|nr:unnamed protein product [Moneuplotes crassus]